MPSSSDSDSDDSILKQSAFQQRPNRREALTKQKQDEYLIQMVKGRRAQTEKNLTLQKMDLESKQRDLEREARRQDRTTTIMPSSTAEVSSLLSSPGNHNFSRRDDVLGENNQHHKETLSCVCPTHPTLYQLSPHLPSTKAHALECLDRLLVGCNDEAFGDNDFKPLLVHHLKHDSFDLGRSVLRNQIANCHGVPIFFWHWLLMMACHVYLPISSRGAHLQLMDLMDQPQNERKFTVRDMVEHWKVYFGMQMEGPTSKADDSRDVKDTKELSEVRSTCTGKDAVGRFLAIWDKLFTRGLVVDRGNEDCEDLSKLVVFLVVAGTDPLLQDNRYVCQGLGIFVSLISFLRSQICSFFPLKLLH
jgi:hypothetical protein